MANENNNNKIQELAMIFIEHRDNKSFTALVKAINWGLRKQIHDVVKNNNAVDEVLCKTLENIYFKCDQYDPEKARFTTWIYKIAYNNSLKYVQERDKVNALTYSEDISNIYDSELKITELEDQDERMLCTGSEFIDILFRDEKVPEVYKKERVLCEIYDASVDCIRFLPDNLRTVIYERFVNSKKIEDIATDNNIPISSVKNWLRKGKTVLKDTVKERYASLYYMYTNSKA